MNPARPKPAHELGGFRCNGKLRCGGAALLILLLASGCAVTTEHINLAYSQQTSVTPIKGAENVAVRVDVKDERTSPEVARKVNGFNIEMAPIIADNDVPELIKSSIETELQSRGFKVGEDNVFLLAQLQTFRNHFQVGFWSGTATADLAMNVMVAGSDRKILFDQHIVAQGVNSGIQLATGNNAKIALDAALQDAMTKLFNDDDFIKSLLGAVRVAAIGQL